MALGTSFKNKWPVWPKTHQTKRTVGTCRSFECQYRSILNRIRHFKQPNCSATSSNVYLFLETPRRWQINKLWTDWLLHFMSLNAYGLRVACIFMHFLWNITLYNGWFQASILHLPGSSYHVWVGKCEMLETTKSFLSCEGHRRPHRGRNDGYLPCWAISSCWVYIRTPSRSKAASWSSKNAWARTRIPMMIFPSMQAE